MLLHFYTLIERPITICPPSSVHCASGDSKSWSQSHSTLQRAFVAHFVASSYIFRYFLRFPCACVCCTPTAAVINCIEIIAVIIIDWRRCNAADTTYDWERGQSEVFTSCNLINAPLAASVVWRAALNDRWLCNRSKWSVLGSAWKWRTRLHSPSHTHTHTSRCMYLSIICWTLATKWTLNLYVALKIFEKLWELAGEGRSSSLQLNVFCMCVSTRMCICK